jgi:3-hydroxyisobutyrate dehydrogenase
MRIAVIGLGRMGHEAATALAAAGHEVLGVDPSEAARERAGAAGLVAAGCLPPDARVELAVLSLPTPEHVTSVCGELGDAGDSLRAVVDLSTIDPATARRAAATLAEGDVAFLDAPVLGRPEMCGSWTLPVGGSNDDFIFVDPVLAAVAERRILVGAVGAGSVVKLLNNLMFGAINAVTAEILAVTDRLGVPPATFVEVLSPSRAASVSGLFRDVGPRIAARRYDDPSFTLALLQKDNDLAAQMLAEAGLQPLIAQTVGVLNRLAVSGGWGDLDTAAMVEAYRHFLTTPESPPDEAMGTC